MLSVANILLLFQITVMMTNNLIVFMRILIKGLG